MLVGCGGGEDAGTDTGSDTGTGGGAGGETGSDGEVAGTITISDFAYGDPLTVPPGALIRVINEDSARHDVDAKDGTSFDTDLIGQGEELTFNAPEEEGTYDFTCSAHPQMSGQLIVSG
ncbi:MAG: cupredoxin domain-containing protein [Geodermatophilaceae bacterium]|nr:cupredoxin domain-containing protein [Geodermatophilaceae bacterium]